VKKKSIENMRDCVKEAFFAGSKRGHEFNKMRHAIIVELKRLGYDSSKIKDKLLEWNDRCEKPLGIGEQRRQLIKYVEWVDKHEVKLGCKALEDYCIGKDKCQFNRKLSLLNRSTTKDLPFDIKQLECFLTERFKADGFGMLLVVKALRWFQIEKATGPTILVGYRTLSSIIRDKHGYNLNPMDVFRKMQQLIDEGLVEQVVKGKGGDFTHQSNGYQLRAWRHA
jgi:hypothetical protein